MYMKNTFLLLSWLILLPSGILANPIKGMLERIDKGASDKFVVELHKSPNDFFELDQKGDKVVIRGNTYINIATGINWYLKYHAGIHLSWNSMHASLPNVLPPVFRKERHETNLALRYDSITAPTPTPWHFGIGNVGKRNWTGWHCMASTCHLLP